MKRLEKNLEDLLSQKSFEELSREDREWVLAQISAGEYTSMRQTLLDSRRVFQLERPQLDPAIQNNLRKSVKLNRQPNPAAGFLKYNIPAWQVVAAACVLFLLFANFKSTFIPQPETVYVHLTDTVYKEIPFRLVDSTFETYPDTNARINSNFVKRINQSPRQLFQKPITKKGNKDSLQVNLPELNHSFATTYDTAVLNGVINNYLKLPADKRRGGNDKAVFDWIERVY